jgi:hypothetical protein
MKSVGALWVDRTFQLKPVEIFLTNLWNWNSMKFHSKMMTQKCFWYSFQDFVEFLKRFTVQINNCNFQSEASRCVKEVNAFVKKNTKGCIPKIIETISPDSRVVLVRSYLTDKVLSFLFLFGQKQSFFWQETLSRFFLFSFSLLQFSVECSIFQSVMGKSFLKQFYWTEIFPFVEWIKN